MPRCHLRSGDQMVSYGAFLIDQPRDTADVLVTCHNPVRESDASVCGEVGYQARLGDIRHNFLAYWPHQSRAVTAALATGARTHSPVRSSVVQRW